MSSSSNILVKEKLPYVHEIIINKPPLNILDLETIRDLIDILNRLKDNNRGIIVLRGQGEKAFSAGVDVADHTKDKAERMIQSFKSLFEVMIDVPQVTISLIKGVALGGGLELAIMTDLVICSKDAKFGVPEIRVGVFPPIAMAGFPYLFGLRTTLDLVLTGRTIKADEALRLGMTNLIIEDESFFDRAWDYINSNLANLSMEVLSQSKRAIMSFWQDDIRKAYDHYSEWYLKKLMNSNDAIEGISAFLEKRKPKWKHS